MKKRNIALVIIYTFITFGIYELFWLSDTRKEMVARGANIPRLRWLFAPLLLLVALVFLEFIIRFLLASPAFNSSGYDVQTGANLLAVGVGIIAVVGLIPVAIYWFYKYSQAVDKVTNGQTSFGLSFGLWMVLNLLNFGFAWPGIIQDGFNKVTTAPLDTPQALQPEPQFSQNPAQSTPQNPAQSPPPRPSDMPDDQNPTVPPVPPAPPSPSAPSSNA